MGILNRIGLTTWKRRLIAGGVGFLVFGIVSTELTSQSWFCNSCHIMTPYYDSWKRGTHKDVACVKCHISPGMDNFLAAKFNGLGQVVDDVLHRTSMKPSTAVNALACTRSGCHDLGGMSKKAKTEGKYLFRHDKHLGLEFAGIKVDCSTCHSHVKGDEHFEVDTNACVTCHLIKSNDQIARGNGKVPETLPMLIRDGRIVTTTAQGDGASGEKSPPASCRSCHNPPTQTIERGGLKIDHSEYLTFGASCDSCHRGNTAAPVPIENGHCYTCHTFGLERLTDTKSMHAIHTQGKHKIECFSCHGTVHHGSAAQTAKLDQFDCRQCHTDQHGVQRETYLHKADAATTVSPMFMAHVDCTGCHIEKSSVSVKPDSGATVAKAVPEACDACHKPGYGKELVTLWQKTTRSLYDQLSSDLQDAKDRIKSDAGKALLEEARHIQDLIRVDGSWGVHNPKYTQQLIDQARQKIREAKTKEGVQ